VSFAASLLILVATLLFAAGCSAVSRQLARNRPLFRDPGISSELRNDLMFGVTILLGFILLIAMTHYENASDSTMQEARAVSGIVTTADGIPNRAIREQIQHDAVCYARSVISDDWTAGDRSDVGGAVGGSLRADRRLNEMSRSISQAARTGLAMDTLIDLDKEVRAHRQERLYQGTPFSTALWLMTIIGVALIIVIGAMLLSTEHAWVQYLITCSTALILAFMLVLIGSFSRPFTAEPPLPSISPEVMEYAITDIREYTGNNPAVMRSCRTTSDVDGLG